MATRIELLENGEAYFPRVAEAIRGAQHEVLIETFILEADEVGDALHGLLIEAATRGVRVQLTIDDYGSNTLPQTYMDTLSRAGVQVHRYAPAPTAFGFKTNLFRRLHRKLVVVDGQVGFIGGINFCADHLRSHGEDSKQDYAARVEGPVVPRMRRLMRAALREPPLPQAALLLRRLRRRARAVHAQGVQLVTRDNALHRDDIERHYLAALRAAQRQVLIANAYFFPSYRLLRAIARAARRGVRVRLLLQGRPDHAVARFAARNLYDYLLRAGVEIHEFTERPFHGKVAVIDEDWATIGSSNLDPLSLALNLEANLVVRDAAFAAALGASLQRLIAQHSRRVQPQPQRPLSSPAGIVEQWLGAVAFHIARRFPDWAGQLPGHAPQPALRPPPLAREGRVQ